MTHLAPPHFCLLSALLASALLWPAGVAAQQQPTSNERVAQQLRDAIERSNAQRANQTGKKGAPAAEVPAVTLNIGGAQGTRLTAGSPTPPQAPSAPAARSGQATARATGQANAAPAQVPTARTLVPAQAPGQALAQGQGQGQGQGQAQGQAPQPRLGRIALPQRPSSAASPDDEVPGVVVRPMPSRTADRYSDEQIRRQVERARAVANGLPVPASARPLRDIAATSATAAPALRDTSAAPAKPRGPIAWSYAGEGGPAAWASLRPDYQLCGSGQRQSPIHIEASATLQGPNEPLGLDYGTGSGTVLHDGRTLRVEVDGNHLLQVRGTGYRLMYLDFHHPGEPVVNHQGFAMSVHLVHRDAQGRTAIVAVLLQPGEANPFIDKVWTYIPLDVGDSVRMPAGWLDVAALLPQDQRYYQYLGSMSTPPCEEGVLWMVLKQPVSVGAAQLQLFARLFPHNARPVQALNGRIVRDAQ